MPDFSTYVTQLSAAFADLDAYKSKPTLLAAADQLVKFLQALDIGLLRPAISDIQQNIVKVGTSPLTDLAAIACAGGVAAEGLFWLLLGMRYVVQFLNRLTGSHDVRGALRGAYDEVLAQHHNIVMRGAFMVGFQFAPNYDEVLEKTNLVVDAALERRIGEICVCVSSVWEIVRAV